MYFITNGSLATATSMLVMDVGDGMFWRQLRDDGFDCFPKFQHSDATNIYQHLVCSHCQIIGKLRLKLHAISLKVLINCFRTSFQNFPFFPTELFNDMKYFWSLNFEFLTFVRTRILIGLRF